MRQFIRVYRYVKIAQKLSHDTDIKADLNISLRGYTSAHAVKASVQRDFKKKYKKITIPEINHIGVDSIKSEYLSAERDMYQHVLIDTLCVTPKGRKLLDFPGGTLQLFLGEYGLVISFATGVFVTTVLLALGRLIWQFGVWIVGLWVY